jgi:hypothetical protein
MEENGVDGVDGLDGATYVTTSSDGKNVYVVSNDGDALVVFGRYVIYLPLVLRNY